LRSLLIAIAGITAFAAGGCSSGPPDDTTVKPGSGVALNPTGKPENAQEAARASTLEQAGSKEAQDALRENEAMNAAKKRAEGK
jgi:hypothetical protein